MSQTITAIVENGVLRPLEPVELPDGTRVELVLRPLLSEAERAERNGRLLELLDEMQAEAAKYPSEWWDEFERELEENRLYPPPRHPERSEGSPAVR